MPNEFVSGDRGGKVVAVCRDNNTQLVIDLTSKTAQLRYKIDGGALVTKTMTVQTPGTLGKAEYQFAAADLTPGTMEAEVRIQPGQADQMTSLHPLYFSVREALS